MELIANFLNIGSLTDFISKETIRRKAQLKLEEEFDIQFADEISKVCGKDILIDIFKTRSELNRELTRYVTSHSIITRKQAYSEYLDVMDRFNESMQKKSKRIIESDQNNSRPCKCHDISRILDDYKELSHQLKIKTKD